MNQKRGGTAVRVMSPHEMDHVHPQHVATSAPLLTDWIPCITPPVREGEYEFERVAISFTGPLRCLYKDGVWMDLLGHIELNAITKFPGEFHWRGIRRWVLVKRRRPDLPDGGLLNTYLAEVNRTSFWADKLEHALGFDTEQQAYDQALWLRHHKLTAVLP